jgi:hypothetical protein
MDIAAAQRDIATAYVGGAPAVCVSGVVWLIAGLVELNHGAQVAFAVLFVGGMLIVPTSLLIGRVLFGAGTVSADNPLERLGFEGTIVLFAGLLIAYVLLRVAPGIAFPVLAVAIGARYFAFRTIYAEPLYWVLGGMLAAIGTVVMLGLLRMPVGTLLLVGIVEFGGGAVLLVRWKHRYIELPPK